MVPSTIPGAERQQGFFLPARGADRGAATGKLSSQRRFRFCYRRPSSQGAPAPRKDGPIVRTPLFDRAFSTRHSAWLLAGAAALSVAPAACSHDGPGRVGESEAGPSKVATAAVTAKIA